MKKTAPNVLMILCHDLGQRLGCYGVRNLKTPIIDALANEGVLCENYFATAPLCSPSRGSIMTGLYPHTNGLMGLVNRGWDMPDTHPTLAQLLRGNGYATELFGGRCCSDSDSDSSASSASKHKALLFGFQHEKKDSLRMGYEEHYHAKGPHTCATVSADFISWLKDRSKDKTSSPFFACLGFFEVHRNFKHPRYTPDNPETVEVPRYLPDMPEVREDLADLHGMIFAVDAAMEKILSALDETKNADNTLLIFSTDHGIAFPRAKSTLYDPGIGTTLILRWKDGFDGGKRYASLLSNIDLLPTVLESVGLSSPSHLQSRSFLPLLRNEKYEPRSEIFAEKTWHDVYDPIRSVRTERFKYIRNFPDKDGLSPTQRPKLNLPTDIERSLSRQALAKLGDPHLLVRSEEELYDLNNDPDELQNIADSPAQASTLGELRLKLMRWMEETDDPLLKGSVPCPDPEMQNKQ